MLFNSYEFLFLFLPIVLLGYYFLPRSWRVVLLTVASYVFYGWWDYRFCSLLLISTVIDYVAGRNIHEAVTPRGRRGWLLVSLVSNLSLLGFFKYYDLGAATVNWLVAHLGGPGDPLVPLLHIILPVGISFYTFQSMSYSIDIYRGLVPPVRDFWRFACYVALFPQLVAGPIIRYHELADQLITRTHTFDKASRGIVLFVLGLAKKVLLADGVAPLAIRVFNMSAPDFVSAWAGLLAYTMQIYFDFSGYSDMAVGLGLMFGFEFPQNFHSPYKSISITDFWRRWHMSLSGWLRDYLYIPLGGNRLGPVRTYVNLFLTMLLGGLWHGANWTFMLWGGYHGALLAIERMAGKRSLVGRLPLPLQRGLTFLLVVFGWVLFRCNTLHDVGAMSAGLLGLHGFGSLNDLWLQSRLAVAMLVPTSLLVWGVPNTWEISWRPGFLLAVGLAVLFVVCVGVIMVNSSSPFLYFQF